MFRRILLLTLIVTGVHLARADEPAVTAVLTNSETEVGQPVQLQIKVSGDSNARPPDEINVDGLDIRYTGESQLVEGRNFRFSYSFIYNYTVMPEKPGRFTIPPQPVRTANGVMRTEPLTLNVLGSNSGAATGRRGSRRSDLGKIAFIDLIIPKTSAYVGEMVPVSIRLGVLERVPGQIVEPPQITGDGFTVAKMLEPQQTTETINGRPYELLTYKTAIAPARAGKLSIGPVEAKAVVRVPRQMPARPRSPQDLFGMDDPFSDPFFADPFAGIPEQRELTLKSDPVTLEVRPLPPNAPESFSGAVGIFHLTTDVKPKKAQVGDPLTVTAAISGRGNFDRVNAPTLEDDKGWHTYPPSSNFKPDDEIGMSGTKSFEIVLTPNEPKRSVPPLVFSYFDPLKEQYLTLKGDRLPVVVEGNPLTTASPAIASASATPARPTPSPQEQDILYQLKDHGPWTATFQPVFMRSVFWGAQAVPLLGLIAFAGWQMRKRRQTNREQLRREAWEEETNTLQRKLRRGDAPADQYYAEALRVVQLKTALAKRVEPNTVDAESAIAAFDLPEEQRNRLQELFRRGDELRYSGRGTGNGAISDQTREEVLELINSLS